MRNQICIAHGRISGHPVSAVSNNTGNEYCNFNVALASGKEEPHIVPMVCFKLTAEYVGALVDGDPVMVQYNVGSNTSTNAYGEERTNLSVFADEVYHVGQSDLPNTALVQGSVTSDPEAKFDDKGNMQCLLRVQVANEWLSRDGARDSRVSVLPFMFTGEMAEQISQHIERGMWIVVGFHVESRTFDKRDGTPGYNPFFVGEWYESDSKPASEEATVSGAEAKKPYDPFSAAADLPFE